NARIRATVSESAWRGWADGSCGPVGGVWGRRRAPPPPDQIDAEEARTRPLAFRGRRRAPLGRRGDGLFGERDRRGRPLPRPLLLPQEAALLGAARRRGPLGRAPRGLPAARTVRAAAPGRIGRAARPRAHPA